MQLHLRPGTAADIPAYVEIVRAAFASNPIHSRCIPHDKPSSSAFWEGAFREEIDLAEARWLVVEAVDGSVATLIAFAKWNRNAAGTHQPLPPDSVWPRDGDVALSVEFFGELFRQHDEIMGDRPHWYLELICTRPGWQGKGAGSLLVRWGCEQADAEGLECYLDATPDGKQLYERCGFREVKTLLFLGGTYEQCFMLRDVRTATASE